LFHTIERYSYDHQAKQYYESFTRQWQPSESRWLIPQDVNAKMTMNTHLHLIEAYANLYLAWPDSLLRQRISWLLAIFDEFIIDDSSGHMLLFFDENWASQLDIVSYGHDIEASWLLQRAAENIKDSQWIERTKAWALKIAAAAVEGLDADGGLWYERIMGHIVREKHWWPQAEAIVGFLNAWELTGDEQWLQRSVLSWTFIKEHIKDNTSGEWHWGTSADRIPLQGRHKASFWKCPYHNCRACLEVIKRIGNLKSVIK
jgi:mannobiose 2-epimerase